MNTVVLLALIGAAFGTSNDFLYRKASMICRKSGPLPFFLMSTAASAIISLCFTIFKSGGVRRLNFGTPDIIFGVVIGVLSFFTYILYFMSFSGDNTSVSVTICKMSMIISIILAVLFLGEVISIKRGAAILLCILSVLLLGGFLTFRKLRENQYVLLSIGACMLAGILNFVNKIAMQYGASAFNLLTVRFAIVVIMTCIFIVIRRGWSLDRKIIKYAVISGLLITLSIYCVLSALKIGDIGLVLPITQLSFTLVVIISWIFFKEEMNAKKVLGVILAAVAVLLIV